MKAVLPALYLSLGLAAVPAGQTQIRAVDIVRQSMQMESHFALYPISGESSVTVEQLKEFYREQGGHYPKKALAKGGAANLEAFCRIYVEEAAVEHIRPEVAFAQAMLETGYLSFGNDVKVEQYNFAGLGATGDGEEGNYFEDVRTGVRAQIQHLKAYASKEALQNTCVDERYFLVTKGCAPYAEWLGQQENPRGLGWATAEDYGQRIAELVRNIMEESE